jgi:cation diffusion facilitator family transporter
MEELTRLKRNVTRLAVASNIALIALKLAVGLFSGAISVISEAAHSGADLIASLVAFFAVRQADKPPDNRHTYGYGKVENLSSIIESVLMISVAIWIVCEAVGKLNGPGVPGYIEYGIAVMILSVIVNWHVSAKLYAAAERTGSHALEADALHLRSDVWTSSGVLAGLAIMKLTGLCWLDPAIAIVVAVIIFKAGYSMARKSLRELTDASLPPEDEEVIRRIIGNHREIVSFRRLRTRRSGSHRLIDVSILLDKEMNIDQAHAICDEIETEIAGVFAPCDTVIHLEPYKLRLSPESNW